MIIKEYFPYLREEEAPLLPESSSINKRQCCNTFLNKIYLEISSPRQRLLNLFIFRTKTIHLNWKIKLENCLVRFFKYRTIKRLVSGDK